MKAETMLKRINTKRKEITRHEKEIAYYQKEYCSNENLKADGVRWIDYHSRLIRGLEREIAEMSKQATALATEDEKKAMIRAMAEDMEKRGIKKNGYTTNGLSYSIYWNEGITKRSRHCYSMNIEGKGTVFTSGTLETVAEYIINN